jgi:PAS domain S-box-containing protein
MAMTRETSRDSKDLFELLVENVQDFAIFMVDLEGHVVSWNPGVERLLGYKEEEFLGRDGSIIFTPEDCAASAPEWEMQMALAEGRAEDKRWHLRKDGTRFWGNGLMMLLRDDAGVARGFAKILRDDTESKHTEESYRSLLDNAHDIIYSHDFAGNYLTINRACEEITGYTREEILGGLNIAQVVAPEHLELARRMTEQKLRDPAPTIYEVDIRTKDGRRLTLEVSTRIAYREGRPFAVEGIGRDVTERKRAEVERQRLLESERNAREEAEAALNLQRRLEKSLTLLVEASGVMLGSPSLESVQPAVLELSRRLVNADAYAVWRFDREKRRWGIVTSAGMSRMYEGRQIEDAEEDYNYFDTPVVAEDVMEMQLLAGRREMYEAEGIRSLLVAPLRVHGKISGTLTFYYRQPHKFEETELRVATALANLAGSAISSAELYEEQSGLRAAAQAAAQRSNFLAEAGRILASSLDYQLTLARVARLAVPGLADWCAVDLLEENGSLKRLAVTHVDPAKVAWAHEMQERYPPDPDAPTGVHNVLRTGKSELYAHITDEMLAHGAKDEEHLKILREMGLSSVMIVALAAHGRMLGAITFVATGAARGFGTEDLALAEALSHRAAFAIDNARLYREAQEANRLKDEFLATVSHELRTPLTAVIGWLHLIRSGQMDDETVERALETVERNARSQAQLIEDLLDVSRVVTGNLRLEMRPVDLASVIDNAITSARPAADAKGISLRADLDPRLPSVSGDSDRLQQVVWNLLSNAVKFTPEGGRVEISTRSRDSQVDIMVRDTGSGIPAEFLPHVFDRFRQADQSTTRAQGGLGLGLAIVRHLVELHGGSVRAESDGADQGSTFIVSLPSAGASATLRQEVSPAHEREEDIKRDDEFTLEGLRVLIVEDDEDACELIAMVLRRRGAATVTASSAAEALDAFARERFDALVSDIGMPVRDGYALIKDVRTLPPERGGNTPAAALTAYAREEDRIKAIEAGFQVHVPKPVNPVELAEAVAALTGRVKTKER